MMTFLRRIGSLAIVSPRRTLVLLVALVLLAPAIALADGDPASDYLTTKQVFVTSQSGPESTTARRLLDVVGAANREGFAIRVAVVSTDYDLGSITELWHKPRIYARFLGIELSLTYKERLLVVMPNGFGINWPNHSTAAAYGLLSKVRIAPGPAGILAAAQTAVRRLAAADGFTVGSPTHAGSSPTVAATRHRDDRVIVFTAVTAALLLLLGVAVARWRRRPRPTVVGEQSGASATSVPIGLRWAVPGVVVLLGLAVGIPVLAVGIFRHANAAPAVRVSSKPALPQVTWAAGRRAAPAFTLRDQVGRRVSLTAYRGRPVIVTFIDPLCAISVRSRHRRSIRSSVRCQHRSGRRSWPSAWTSTPTHARTCSEIFANGSSCPNGNGPSAPQLNSPTSGSTPRSACPSSPNTSPGSRSTTSLTPKSRSSSTPPDTCAPYSSGRSTPEM